GAIALLKEAHPNWSNEKILGALKTTGKQTEAKRGLPHEPISQGTGLIQPERAIETPTVLYDSTLTFGEFSRKRKTATADVTIENTTSEPQDYSFQLPPRTQGVNFHLPLSFTIEPKEKKTVTIEIKTQSKLLDQGIHQGRFVLEREDNVYDLPYLVINENTDDQNAMRFKIYLKAL